MDCPGAVLPQSGNQLTAIASLAVREARIASVPKRCKATATGRRRARNTERTNSPSPPAKRCVPSGAAGKTSKPTAKASSAGSDPTARHPSLAHETGAVSRRSRHRAPSARTALRNLAAASHAHRHPDSHSRRGRSTATSATGRYPNAPEVSTLAALDETRPTPINDEPFTESDRQAISEASEWSKNNWLIIGSAGVAPRPDRVFLINISAFLPAKCLELAQPKSRRNPPLGSPFGTPEAIPNG